MRWRAIGSLLVLFLGVQVASACSCAMVRDTGPCKGLPSGILFVGTVVSVDNPPSEDGDQVGTATYTFRVDEVIAGKLAPQVKVESGRGGGDSSFWFRQGQQYLVQPYQEKNNHLHASLCTMTQPVEDAVALLPQLRAMRDKRQVASVYGLLERESLAPETDFTGPVTNVPVSLKGDKGTFTSSTDHAGSYAFYDIPGGKYELVADLPLGLRLGFRNDRWETRTVDIAQNACTEMNVVVTSTATVRGRVVFADGTPATTDVQLFRVGHYREDDAVPWRNAGISTYQGGSTPDSFFFEEVPPGDYIVAVNHDHRLPTADEPFAQTFYPSTTKLEEAGVIHVGPGEQVGNVTLVVKRAIETRPLRIRVDAPGINPDSLYVRVEGNDESPFALPVSPGLFRVKIQKTGVYTISAVAFCQMGHKSPTTQPVKFDAADGPEEITLAFAGQRCDPK